MALLSTLGPAVASNLGDLVYELILSNWGNWGTKRDPDNGSEQFPPVPFEGVSIPVNAESPLGSVSGIAIAPRSNVDRCIVRYNVHRKLDLPPGQPRYLNNGGVLEAETMVSVESPLIGQLAGPITVRASAVHWFADTYVPADIAAPSPLPAFGTALSPTTFINPELRLLIYLGSRTVLPPRGRAPFYVEIMRVFTAAEVGTEVLLQVVPVMGRNRLRVTFAASGGTGPGSNVNVRTTGTFSAVAPGVPATNPIPQVTVQELLLDGPATIDADIGGVATFTNEHPQVSFLLLKATPTVANVTLRVAVEARD